MTAKEITRIYRDIFKNGLLYCGVCLRTERERKLVEPVFYRKCINVFHLGSADYAELRTCVVCEAHARRAYHMYSAASFAAVVDNWFQSVPARYRYCHDVAYDVNRIVKDSKFEDLPMSEYWRLLRSRTELLQTEILNTCTYHMEDEGNADTCHTAPTSPAPSLLLEVTSSPVPPSFSMRTPTPSPESSPPSSPEMSRTSSPVWSPGPSRASSPSVSSVSTIKLTISPTPASSPTNYMPEASRAPVTSRMETSFDNNIVSNSDMAYILVIGESKKQTTVATQTDISVSQHGVNPRLVPISTLLSRAHPYDIAKMPGEPCFLSRDESCFYLHPAQALPDGNHYIPSLNGVAEDAFLRPASDNDTIHSPQVPAKYTYVKFINIADKTFKLQLADVHNSPVKYSRDVEMDDALGDEDSLPVEQNSPPVDHIPVVNVDNPPKNSKSSIVILSNVLVNKPAVSAPLVSVGGMQFVTKPTPGKRPLLRLCLRKRYNPLGIQSQSGEPAMMDWLYQTPVSVDWEEEIPIDIIYGPYRSL